MRILIADMVSLVRSGCIHLLGTELPGSEFLEATTFAEVLEVVQSTELDMLIIDPDLPGSEGGAGLLSLRNTYPTLRIVALGMSSERAAILSYVLGGMNGYVIKTMPNEQTVNAIRTVLGGGAYVPFILTQGVPVADAPLVAPAESASPGAPLFTERQREVLQLLAEGRSTKDIARILDLGVGTVKVHLSAVYRILGAHSRMEAVIRAGAMKY